MIRVLRTIESSKVMLPVGTQGLLWGSASAFLLLEGKTRLIESYRAVQVKVDCVFSCRLISLYLIKIFCLFMERAFGMFWEGGSRAELIQP
jgi:hypothetical protein